MSRWSGIGDLAVAVCAVVTIIIRLVTGNGDPWVPLIVAWILIRVPEVRVSITRHRADLEAASEVAS